MAYLNHDLEDAIRSGVVDAAQVPKSCSATLGHSHSQRATTMIRDLISTSAVRDGKLCLQLSDGVHDAMMALRQFLYENVYRSPKVHKDFEKSKKILFQKFKFYPTPTPNPKQKMPKNNLKKKTCTIDKICIKTLLLTNIDGLEQKPKQTIKNFE